jgi:hypothetical protein
VRVRKPFRRFISSAVALALFVSPLKSQSLGPTARVVEEYVSTGTKGRAIGVRLGFDITWDRAIAQSSLYYRIQGDTQYKLLKLKREPNLRCTAFVRETQTFECYLSLKPENGQKVSIWTADNPLHVPTADLEHKRDPNSGWTAHSKFIIIAVGAIIAAIIGVAKEGKH